jgi:hypothetical protein
VVAYFGLVFFTDISCHETNTRPITCTNIFLRLFPLSQHPSFKTEEVDCTYEISDLFSFRLLLVGK